MIRYYTASSAYLRAISVPVHLLNVDSSDTIIREDIQLTIDCFYRSIVEVLHLASSTSVPKLKCDFYKFWWDEELTALKQSSIESYNLWLAAGKPRFGCEFLAMKRAKAAYKLAIKTKERGSRNEFTNCLNDVLLRKDMDSFWRSWRAKFGSNSHAKVIDGCSDDSNIANKFATVFESTCVPNSSSRHDSLKTKIMTQFDKYIDNTTLPSCNVDLVNYCDRHLKRGKAAGHDELTVEHLQYAHPISVVLLSLLFNMLILHGMVPLDFAKGIIIPLIKKP